MKTRKSYRVAFLISVFVIGICLIFCLSDTGKIQQIIVTLTAVVGSIAIWFEMKRSKDMAVGEFITSLNESFNSNEDVKMLYKKLISNEPITREDQLEVVEYLTFFETIFLLLRQDIISIDFLDDLFSYRFFVAVNNKDIQKLELIPDAKYYKNIYTLDYQWRIYREKHHKDVDNINSLRAKNKDYMDYVERK